MTNSSAKGLLSSDYIDTNDEIKRQAVGLI